MTERKDVPVAGHLEYSRGVQAPDGFSRASHSFGYPMKLAVRRQVYGALYPANYEGVTTPLDEYRGPIDPGEQPLVWGSMAETYAQSRTPIVNDVVVPAVHRFLAEMPSQKDGEPLRLVDLGCGPGKMIEVFLAHANVGRVIAVDNCPKMVEQARKRVDAFDWRDAARVDVYEEADPDELLFRMGQNSVDAAFLGSVVMTLDNYRYVSRLFEALFQMLSGGGKVLITTTNTDALGTLPSLDVTEDNELIRLLLENLEEFRVRGTPIQTQSGASKSLKDLFGDLMNEGEWGSFKVADVKSMSFDRETSNIVMPKPRQIGEPYLVLGKFAGEVACFRDRYYTLWEIVRALIEAGFNVDTSMRSPYLDDGSSWAARMQARPAGQLTIIQATKPPDVRVAFPVDRPTRVSHYDHDGQLSLFERAGENLF